MTAISIYKNVQDTTSTNTITLISFLTDIQAGKWQDAVLKIRTIDDKDMRKVEKTKLPSVTISGIFGKRTDNDCKLHSGFIAIDLDNLNNEVESTRELLRHDPYIYSGFTSVSGTGLCLLFKIDSDKHRDAFEGIADYLIKKYQLIVDPTGVNQSRLRFVSYDPELFINEDCLKFKKYLPKPKSRKITATIFVQSEFDEVIKKMVEANVSCVEDYRDWRDIAFGLADQFGESGRQYFHSLSSCSAKYEQSMCDRQYSHAIARNGKQTNKITIATIYWFAKQAGINTYSEKTNKIAAAVTAGKKQGLDAKIISMNLAAHEGITDADEVINQAMQSNIPDGESLVNSVRMWLRHNHKLRRNSITRKVENDGIEITDTTLNSMFLDAAVIYPKLTHDLFCRIVFSNNTPDYNPIKIYIESSEWDGHCRIEQLSKCITSETGTPEWRERMITKWLVGIIHSVYGGKNELNFIFVGAKNTGKTEFFRRLLPDNLQQYFAESQLNRGKDDEILMCEKLIIFNDEYGGKNRNDERNEKRLMASSEFSLREPYGKSNITLKRLATLCGTCNEKDVLDDPTGNRRIIIIEASGKFNYELYNSIDKQQLLAEARSLWHDGERPELADEDIIELESTTDGQYSKVSFEEEMIVKYMLPPGKCDPWAFMMATEVKNTLEQHTREKININKLGARIRKLGYARESRDGRYGYQIAPIPPIVVTTIR